MYGMSEMSTGPFVPSHDQHDANTTHQERPKRSEYNQTKETGNTSNQKQDSSQQQKKAPNERPPNKQPGSDKVSSPSASSHCSRQSSQTSAPLPPELVKELANIKAELALLRQENYTLRQENKVLKSQLENRPQGDLDTNPPASKRRAVDDSPENGVEEPMEDDDVDKRITILEKSLTSVRKTFHEQKNELQSNMTAMQASIEALRNELHTFISNVVQNISTSTGLVPQTGLQTGLQHGSATQ
ncbi:hypothetical protein HPB48_007296 [Haemaphysalis longicornis]|uniref:Uncharacterized protein n=1 Tax=Haemaphysalis longicornis TaxID=44386 RepID=A0A9J6GX76_HAELO|nr:hypothetical protein HPB48_007296 [Haemaphysalis longicornis]